MVLYKANGEIWHPHYEDTRALDDLLRRIVDAIRYRHTTLGAQDAYGKALARLSDAATEYTATLRSDPTAAGPVPEVRRRAS
jgi:hypothetical protein